ncbi:MAG: tetratricopeptide repeat protein [Sphingobacteriales bacterium]|nr:MAG: tetratricopeptide repeat protein [Sphingobacteriales bacterium]
MIYRYLFCIIAFMFFVSGCKEKAVTKSVYYKFPSNSATSDSILAAAKLLSAAAKEGTDQEKIVAAIYMGIYYVRTSAYRQARYEYNNVLAKAIALNDSVLTGNIYLGLANSAKNLGEYPEALNLFSKSLDFFPSYYGTRAAIYASIAQIFQLQNDLKQATIHLKYALALSGNNKENRGYLLTLHTLANVHGMNGFTDSALMLDEEGIAISKKIKDQACESTFLDNKANCFMYTNRPDSARYYFHKSLLIDSALGDKKQMSDTWLNLGELERRNGNSEKAEQYLKHSIQLANGIGYRNGEVSGYKSLSEVYATRKDFEQALTAESMHHSIKDSIINLKKETAIAEWKTVYETEKKEDEIKMQSLQLKKKNTSIWFVSISSVLMLSALYFANRRNKERKEKLYRETLLIRDHESAIKILVAEENERKRIAGDLHDGVGQTLTAAWLNLQAVHSSSGSLDRDNAKLLQTTIQLVRESCAEIRQISHNMMPDILYQKGLLPALNGMISRINEKQLIVSLSAGEYDVPQHKTRELILYRIIQECVNNVVRHAKATALYISIHKEEEHIAVLIEDNGIGIDVNRMWATDGLGLQSIRSRVEYLHGSVEWNNVNDDKSGTVVAIYIPLFYEPIS